MAVRYHYRETSVFAWWAHLIIWVCVLASVVPALWPVLTGSELPVADVVVPLAIGLGLLVLFYGLFGSLRTRVTSDAVELSWGMSGIIRKVVPFSQIRGMEPVSYRPIRDFGGWGIRFRGKKRAWTVRGTQALILHLEDGIKLYVGSEYPARLEERIRSAMSMNISTREEEA